MPVERCECIGWVREYGVGRPGELHHRNCRRWSERVGDAYVTKTELIVTGDPGEDENHNCDAMGCSTVSHVLFRMPLAHAIAGVQGKPCGHCDAPPGEVHSMSCPIGRGQQPMDPERARTSGVQEVPRG